MAAKKKTKSSIKEAIANEKRKIRSNKAKKSAPKYQKPKEVKRLGVGKKHAMELLCDRIKSMGRKPPELNLTMTNPASAFVISMYDEFAKWDAKQLSQFIAEVTKKDPPAYDVPGLLGESKRVLHEMFNNLDPMMEKEVRKYDSVWKMWPHVRRKGKPGEEDSEMADKRATKKKAAGKKVAKKASKKKTAKKVSKKKTAKTSSGVTEDTKVKAVPDSKTPKLENRKKVKTAAKSAIKVSKLIEKTGCTVRTVNAMIERGFLEVV